MKTYRGQICPCCNSMLIVLSKKKKEEEKEQKKRCMSLFCILLVCLTMLHVYVLCWCFRDEGCDTHSGSHQRAILSENHQHSGQESQVALRYSSLCCLSALVCAKRVCVSVCPIGPQTHRPRKASGIEVHHWSVCYIVRWEPG